MRVLELFKGTGSIGKALKKYKDVEVISLDIDKKYNPTICEDILTWDYTIYPNNYFDLITLSPVCQWWSPLRNSWIGRKCKTIHPTDIITKELIMENIKENGHPQIYKCFEIIDYFSGNPNLKWWMENPRRSKLWKHLEEEYKHRFPYYINNFSYCKYSTEEDKYEYEKPTTFITNYDGVDALTCQKDCSNIIIVYTKEGDKHPSGNPIKSKTRTLHKRQIGMDKNKDHQYKDKPNINEKMGGGTNKDMRYRIPQGLIHALLKPIIN